MEDFIVQKTVFHNKYEPGGLGNYTVYNVCTKK